MPADADVAMGAFSPVARLVSAALQDSATRVRVYRALKMAPGRLGLDLQLCQDDPLIHEIFDAGERFGAGVAASHCAFARAQGGLVLYMDHDRLQHWDPSVSPIVTAIANIDTPSAATFHGYRSPVRMIDLPADGSVQGPILVILPIQHSTRSKLAGPLPPVQSVVRATPSPKTP